MNKNVDKLFKNTIKYYMLYMQYKHSMILMDLLCEKYGFKKSTQSSTTIFTANSANNEIELNFNYFTSNSDLGKIELSMLPKFMNTKEKRIQSNYGLQKTLKYQIYYNDDDYYNGFEKLEKDFSIIYNNMHNDILKFINYNLPELKSKFRKIKIKSLLD